MGDIRKRHRRASTASIIEEPEQACGSRRPHSQVVEFYKGRCVLVTGVSGFLGKLIIEKLLRTCTGIKKIFVLIRPKNNKKGPERLNELFNSYVFDKLKSDCEHNNGQSFEQLKSKVIVLQGSLEQPFLGLNIERLLQLADEVSVVIHSAAVITFEGKLRSAIDVNLLGTRNLLQLACKLPKLSAFIYVSTCYSNCTREQINEHVYPVEIEPEYLIDSARWSSDKSLELWRNQLIGDHPNIYTYTKQLAEYLCAEFCIGGHQLPVLICRPSIIVATSEEPIKGFVDNRNAGNGIANGVSQGFLQLVQGRSDVVWDMIPADFVSNCVISLAWFADIYHRVKRKLNPTRDFPISSTNIEDEELEKKMIEFYGYRKKRIATQASGLGLSEELSLVPVVHVSSGLENPITLGETCRAIGQHTLNYPSLDLFRRPSVCFTRNNHLYRIVKFLNQTLVGKLMDRLCTSPTPQLVSGGFKGVRRSLSWSEHFASCDHLMRALSFFLVRSFRFAPDTRLQLIDHFMNDDDRRLFNCDVRHLDWDLCMREMTLGIRRYLIGNSDETLPMAREKFERTLRRNSLIKIVLIAFFGLLLLACLFR